MTTRNTLIGAAATASCTGLGQGQKNQSTVLNCFHFNGSYYWDYLYDNGTKKAGWVREDNLRVVSFNRC